MRKPIKERSKKKAQSSKKDSNSCAKALVRFLRKELRKLSISPECIAAVIACYYLQHKKSPGVKLPTQAFLKFSLDISAAKLELVWKSLMYDYQIIRSCRSTGTLFTAIIDSEHKRQIESRINSGYNRPGTNFYDPTLSGLTVTDKNWQKLKPHWLTAYEHHPCNDESLDKLELERHLLPRFSAMMNYEFKQDELTFCGRYMSVLDRLIGRNGHLKGEVVVLRPNITLQEEQGKEEINMLKFFGLRGMN